MTAKSADRIRRSFELLAPCLPQFAAACYARFFAARPETRALFKTDLTLQANHFAASIALIVRNLAMLDALEEPLRELGTGHAALGVRPDHYPPLCDAMLASLAEALTHHWTDELAADWRALLTTLCHHMLAGSNDPDPGAAVTNH